MGQLESGPQHLDIPLTSANGAAQAENETGTNLLIVAGVLGAAAITTAIVLKRPAFVTGVLDRQFVGRAVMPTIGEQGTKSLKLVSCGGEQTLPSVARLPAQSSGRLRLVSVEGKRVGDPQNLSSFGADDTVNNGIMARLMDMRERPQFVLGNLLPNEGKIARGSFRDYGFTKTMEPATESTIPDFYLRM